MAEMAEVIAFIIENFQDFDQCPDADDLGRILEDVGFDDVQIGNMLLMMSVLADTRDSALQPYSDAMRVYTPEELDVLPQEVVSLLHYLVQENALSPSQRELVIHSLFHIPFEDITVDVAKIFTLLVLWAHKSEPPVLIGDDLMMALHGQAVMH